MIKKSAAITWELLGVDVPYGQVRDVLEDHVAEANLPAVQLCRGASVLTVVDGVRCADRDDRRCGRIKAGITKTAFLMKKLVRRGDDVVGDRVGGGVSRRGVAP